MLKNIAAIIILWALLGCMSFAQGYPQVDVYGGYSYIGADFNELVPRQSFNGWNTSVSANFTKVFAAEFQFGGNYKTVSASESSGDTVIQGSVAFHDYSFLAGPRVNFRPFFAHALIGGDHLNINIKGSICDAFGCQSAGASGSQDSLAGAFGGGVQQRISGPWSVQVSADYVFTRHNLLGGPSFTQNNFRIGAGVVYTFGRSSSSPSSEGTRKQTRNELPSIQRATMAIPQLGVSVQVPEIRTEGAEIVSITPGGIAELANLHLGDILTGIDEKPVKTPMELAAALASSTPGSQVRLKYMFRSTALGYFAKETVVMLSK